MRNSMETDTERERQVNPVQSNLINSPLGYELLKEIIDGEATQKIRTVSTSRKVFS